MPITLETANTFQEFITKKQRHNLRKYFLYESQQIRAIWNSSAKVQDFIQNWKKDMYNSSSTNIDYIIQIVSGEYRKRFTKKQSHVL